MQHESEVKGLDLENILELFDQSVKEKFERCATSIWCTNATNGESDRKSFVEQETRLAVKIASKSTRCRNAALFVCSKSKWARKVARKLEHINVKLSKLKIRATKAASPKPIQEQIRQGSNKPATPANSRPSSITTTLNQIEKSRWKHADYARLDTSAMLCGASS